MNRWAKTLYGIAILGAFGWLAAGWVGRGAGRESEDLVVHTMVALAAALAWLLADLWVPIYFGGCVRALRRGERGAAALEALGADGRRVAGLAFVAALLVLGQLVLAGSLYPKGPPVWIHVGLAVCGLVAQVAFLAFAARALGRLERALEGAGAGSRHGG